jgi:hypothetical protein
LHALNQRDLDPSDPREVKLGLREDTSALKDERIRRTAGDIASQFFNAFSAF